MLAGYEDAGHLSMVMDGLSRRHDQGDPHWLRAQDNTEVVKLTDCRSKLGEVNAKRLAIDLCGMRQMVWRGRNEEVGDPLFSDRPPEDATTRVYGISAKTMLADPLTKRMDGSILRTVMDGQNLAVDFQGTSDYQVKTKTGVKKDVHSLAHLDSHWYRILHETVKTAHFCRGSRKEHRFVLLSAVDPFHMSVFEGGGPSWPRPFQGPYFL